MDVDTTFLNSRVKEEIHIRQPPGFILPGTEHLVCLLHNSLYSLRQSSKAWYDTLHEELCALGWIRSSFDNNLYYIQNESFVTILLTYVDDFLITGSSPSVISFHKASLQQSFRMKDLGLTRKFLGIELDVSPAGISWHQSSYALGLLTEFKMQDCTPA